MKFYSEEITHKKIKVKILPRLMRISIFKEEANSEVKAAIKLGVIMIYKHLKL